ncbi:MAG: hypothetical protein AUJ49_11160 [Desulfovibrionaceae bacterium CG1_02_65_16]|nr:MAG: hypothetical protein AUJ49_11160 [Desulfovibrionaceae bacterium CG1_02_65_16]
MTNMSRRDVLGWLGGAALGGVLAGVGGVVATAGDGLAAKNDKPKLKETPKPAAWVPHKLNAVECAPVAYAGYWDDGLGCCYGSFHAIIGAMGEKFGAPYNQFPFRMMEVGKSGISEWGTICGALLGAASAYALFWGRKERDPMVTELFRWYERTAFPIYDPGAGAQGAAGPLPTHVPGSVLCHISVSSWCQATGIDAGNVKRSERCARVTADVTSKAIEIMNAKIDGTFAPALKSQAEAACGACHGKGKVSPMLKGRMDCTPCHGGSAHVQDKFHNHP